MSTLGGFQPTFNAFQNDFQFNNAPISLGGTGIPGGRSIMQSKKAGETITYQFNFQASLAANETIIGSTSQCKVYQGIDPLPELLLQNNPNPIGVIVYQTITGGIVGVVYEIVVTITTSLNNIIEQTGALAIEADLPV
jgi:hypothetical protein